MEPNEKTPASVPPRDFERTGSMPLTQQEAIEILKHQNFYAAIDEKCTGVAKTCPVDECSVCAVRECPHQDELHFHHDGCPSCFVEEEIEKKEHADE